MGIKMAKEIIEFNLNDHIIAEITPKGYDVLREHWPDVLGYDEIPDFKDGIWDGQLWGFMRIFGSSMGAGFDLVCKTEIKLYKGL